MIESIKNIHLRRLVIIGFFPIAVGAIYVAHVCDALSDPIRFIYGHSRAVWRKP